MYSASRPAIAPRSRCSGLPMRARSPHGSRSSSLFCALCLLRRAQGRVEGTGPRGRGPRDAVRELLRPFAGRDADQLSKRFSEDNSILSAGLLLHCRLRRIEEGRPETLAGPLPPQEAALFYRPSFLCCPGETEGAFRASAAARELSSLFPSSRFRGGSRGPVILAEFTGSKGGSDLPRITGPPRRPSRAGRPSCSRIVRKPSSPAPMCSAPVPPPRRLVRPRGVPERHLAGAP